MRKYGNHVHAAPVEASCGLAIDLDYPDIPGFTDRPSIQCINGTSLRSVSLVKNGVLEFKSRMINGSFTRGYCMQVLRGNMF